MALTEAADFGAESETLDALLRERDEADFARATQFKGWSVDDVLVHLHLWNQAADLSLRDEPAFRAFVDQASPALRTGRLRAFENARLSERGHALRRLWIDGAREMARRWAQVDPKRRLPWAGPSMSARTSIAARQMEVWAHGFEAFDLFGRVRAESDRVRNIVMLGVNTFGWSHQVRGLAVPPVMPALELAAPSGALWSFGDPSAGRIVGPAVDFAAVVTQTRAVEDTRLRIQGAVAEIWMKTAQCFAGPATKPPEKGQRFCSIG